MCVLYQIFIRLTIYTVTSDNFIHSNTDQEGRYLYPLLDIASMAQLVEHSAVNRKVIGSIPIRSVQLFILHLFTIYD